MDDTRLSRSLIKLYKDIDISMASLWSNQDLYSSIPVLGFRILGRPENDSFYDQIGRRIRSFNGYLRWTLLHLQGETSYSILPEVFVRPHFLLSNHHDSIIMIDEDITRLFWSGENVVWPIYTKEGFVAEKSEELYISIMNQVVLDSPNLAKFIESWSPDVV